MKFVQFYNLMTESMYDGFLVKEDANYYWTLDPICYEWLLCTNQLHLIEYFEPHRWEKEFYPYQDAKLSETWSAIKNQKWLFGFPLNEQNVQYTQRIANYFDWFVYNPNIPLTERISRAEKSTSYSLTPEMHQELAAFIYGYFRSNPNGLRTLLGQ